MTYPSGETEAGAPAPQTDLIVIGGGPGGYVAAIRAAQLGMAVALVERADLGGICCNWGCIPTKALLRSAEVLKAVRHADDFGVKAGEARADFKAVMKRSRAVAEQMRTGVGYLLKKNKVRVVNGFGRLLSADAQRVNVAVDDGKGSAEMSARHVIVATGARPRALLDLEADGDRIWTYMEALAAKECPKSLCVVGSGAIGMEMASFYRALGAEVSVLEILPRILPAEDVEIAELAKKRFEAAGIVFHTNARITALKKTRTAVIATVDVGGRTSSIRADRLLVAVGVTANIEKIGLKKLSVQCENGVIVTDGHLRTNVPGVYAIGDVAGPPMLAHKAEHEAIACVDGIAGRDHGEIDRTRVPGCVYTDPQIASVGLTEEGARKAKRAVKVGRFPFAGNGKAIALGEPEGLVKTLFDQDTGELLGAHLIGAEVTELIHGFVLAMNLEATEEDIMGTIFPHPTLSETMLESTLSAFGRAIHI